MIKDANGTELIYWPISGLIEGEVSETLDFTVQIPGTGSKLYATDDSRLKTWVKKVGDAGFTDLSGGAEYDLTGLTGDVDFQCYIEALSPISGLERVPVSVVAGIAHAAGWFA